MDEKVKGRVIDAHSHIGKMDAWKFYNLKEPVKPTVYEFADAEAYLDQMDVGRRRARPDPAQLRDPGPEPAVLAQRPGPRRSVQQTTGWSAACGCRSSRRTRR